MASGPGPHVLPGSPQAWEKGGARLIWDSLWGSLCGPIVFPYKAFASSFAFTKPLSPDSPQINQKPTQSVPGRAGLVPCRGHLITLAHKAVLPKSLHTKD